MAPVCPDAPACSDISSLLRDLQLTQISPDFLGMDSTSESQVDFVRGVMISTVLLAIISTIARFYCRKISNAGLQLDDWLIIPALIVGTIPTILVVTWQIDHGFAKHIWASSNFQDTLTVFLKVLFIGEATYFWSIGFTKFSILALYWRIFKRNLKIPIIVVACVVACWVVGSFISVMLSCIPIQGFWDKTIQAYCGVKDKEFYYGTSIPNIITDVILLALPVSSVWKLKISLQQKFMLTFVFILGGFVLAVSIVRLVVLINLDSGPDVTWTLIGTEVWTVVEMSIAIVSANLPSLKPLFNQMFYGSPLTSRKKSESWNSSTRNASIQTTERGSHPNKPEAVFWDKYKQPYKLELNHDSADQFIVVTHDLDIVTTTVRSGNAADEGAYF